MFMNQRNQLKGQSSNALVRAHLRTPRVYLVAEQIGHRWKTKIDNSRIVFDSPRMQFNEANFGCLVKPANPMTFSNFF